jgi:hypothetical protein
VAFAARPPSGCTCEVWRSTRKCLSARLSAIHSSVEGVLRCRPGLQEKSSYSVPA